MAPLIVRWQLILVVEQTHSGRLGAATGRLTEQTHSEQSGITMEIHGVQIRSAQLGGLMEVLTELTHLALLVTIEGTLGARIPLGRPEVPMALRAALILSALLVATDSA